jgi:hypothetical protein
MARMMTRPFTRRAHPTHPLVWMTGGGPLLRKGTVPLVTMYGPAGIVGPVGATDHPYMGMDPSDPTTWTRPYNPQPGMIGQLNFDGAKPREEQTQLQRKRQRRQFYRGGVAGASVRGNHQ